MANELKTSVSISAAKGNLSLSRSKSNSIDMAGTAQYAGGAVSVATTSAGVALGLGSVSTPGVSFFQNIDATHYIEVGVQVGGTFYPFLKLMPGEAWMGRLATAAPYARANTSAAVLDYAIFET